MFDPNLLRVAEAVVAANKSGEIEALLNDFYADDAVSVEAAGSDGMPRAAEGLDAIRAKHAWWNEAMEMHDSTVEGPFLFDPDRFAVRFSMDVTNRQTGEKVQGAEVGVYTVQNGKVVREEFFWAPA
ncbi:MAG: nuclear transport factor 2 family protein [Pseudomonadota bacterium]